MIKHNIELEVWEKIFKDHSVRIDVFLRSSKVKGTNFDKFRDVGYKQTYQNPVFLNAMTKNVSPNSLIIRELGLTETGALQIIVKDDDFTILKLAERIIIDEVEYTPRNKALGNRFQVEKLPFNYKKCIVFRINE